MLIRTVAVFVFYFDNICDERVINVTVGTVMCTSACKC